MSRDVGRKRILAALLASAALVAAGCGGDDDETSTTSTTTTEAGATGASGATGAEGSSELSSIEGALKDAGYDVFPIEKPYSKSGAAGKNGATDGIYANKGDLTAEVFVFPSEADAEGYTEDIDVLSQGSPSAVVGTFGFSAAQDDDQSTLDELVEASGAE